MMRVLMVSDNYFPHVGGIPVHIDNLARGLRKRGHTVEVLTGKYDSQVLDGFTSTPDEELVHRVGRATLLRSNKSWASLPLGFHLKSQVKSILARGYDVVHIHGALTPMLPLLALRYSRTRNVITLHAYHSESKGYKAFKPALRRYFNRLDGIIGVSRAAVESVERCFPGDYTVIPNGIDPAEFSPTTPPLSGLNGRRPRLLFVGRFEPKKGLKYLLRALPRIKREHPNFELMVVGSGPLGYSYREHIPAELQEHVRFCGVVDPHEVPAYYAACDLFCAPSVDCESFGIILLEAMATGKPVVASDIPGFREVVRDGEDGVLVAPRAPDRLADAITMVLQDEGLRRRLVDNGRRKALAYSWSSVAERVEALYDRVLTTSTRRLPTG